MRVRHLAAALAALLACTQSTAHAEPWTGADYSRRPGLLIGSNAQNLDIAIAEVCFPYILQNADPASWQAPHRVGIRATRNAPDVFEGKDAFTVGADVVVGVEDRNGVRSCLIMVDGGAPEEMRTAALARIAQMPGAMTPSPFQYAPGNYTRRELYCAPAAGPHDALVMSTGPRTDRSRISFMITFLRTDDRSERCDGVAPS